MKVQDKCHSREPKVVGDQYERMFSKLEKQANRHKKNFKYANYTLDEDIKEFNKERKKRLDDIKKERMLKEMEDIELPEYDRDNNLIKIEKNQKDGPAKKTQ